MPNDQCGYACGCGAHGDNQVGRHSIGKRYQASNQTARAQQVLIFGPVMLSLNRIWWLASHRAVTVTPEGSIGVPVAARVYSQRDTPHGRHYAMLSRMMPRDQGQNR